MTERDDAEEARKRALIEESNQAELLEPDHLGNLHKMMQSRNGIRRARLFSAQYDHEHPRRAGWGRYRDLNRKEFQEYVDRAHKRNINRELDLAEEEDRKANPDFYR